MEKHQVQLKSVPIAYDKRENRYVCQKCGNIFRTIPSDKSCKAPKYFKVVKYRDAK